MLPGLGGFVLGSVCLGWGSASPAGEGPDGDQLGIPVYEDLKRNKRELIGGFQKWGDEEWPPERILETYGPATWAQDGSWGY
ncbi:hypothetical protein DUI87_34763 [Hirundo rustica rustica]|uniref:Uncharacterized protein n=1 Tax=Hirundo rustica rustica TaxID=333673 RepID=A0A3M0IQU7_HIRRU|nr:hypothetical protein DUI87_34763 [Hirundo rustica rustica]